MEALVARASIVVGASRRAVSGWRLGQPFEWTFDMAGTGKRLSVQAFVHRIEPERLLEYEYTDPFNLRNVHRVTIELSDEVGGTRVGVVQDANVTQAAHLHAEGGWRLALNNLRGLMETV
jgi:uncharacterized protein YndB with AHSA1/START domain